MDPATLVGAVLGAIVILMSILLGGDLGAFINAPGLAVVVGGTICAALVAETMGNCIGAFKVAGKALFNRSHDVETTIESVVTLAKRARREGLAALEGEELDDEFLGRGLGYVLTGAEAESVREMLEAELASMKRRHKRGRDLFKFLASTAPAMGMVGTLIGLVQMLQTLDDPASIGPAMAVAMLTTLYGAVLAFMAFGPIAEKLDKRSGEEGENMVLAIEGLEAIARGDNPALLRSRLESLISPKRRTADGKA